MPYFRLAALSREFIDVIAHDSLKRLIEPDTVVYRVTVLSSSSRARTLLFLARIHGGTSAQKQIVSPDWWSSEFDPELANELQILTTQQVCIYDPEDDFFHPTDVTPRVTDRFRTRIGILGWNDLRKQFELNGVTTHGNLVLFAEDGAKCRSRSMHMNELPQPIE